MNQEDRDAGSPERVRSAVQQALWTLTGVLGLAAWAVGLTGSPAPESAATLAVLAGAVAVVGLVPGQAVRGWLVVAVAVTAIAVAISTTATADGLGWRLVVIDVLIALQVVVAVSALLLESRFVPATQIAPENDYAAYAEYIRAYQEYARQYDESQWPEQYSASGLAEAAGDARGATLQEEDAWEQLQARYARHVSSAAPGSPEHTVRPIGAGDTTDAGMPGADRAARPHHAEGRPSPSPASASPGAH